MEPLNLYCTIIKIKSGTYLNKKTSQKKCIFYTFKNDKKHFTRFKNYSHIDINSLITIFIIMSLILKIQTFNYL